jgi:hypothetical protein
MRLGNCKISTFSLVLSCGDLLWLVYFSAGKLVDPDSTSLMASSRYEIVSLYA